MHKKTCIYKNSCYYLTENRKGFDMKLKEDLKGFAPNGIGKKIGTVFFNPCFHSVVLYRLSNLFYKMHLSVLSKFLWYLNRMLFHVDIDYRADLAGGFVLIHGLGTVIGKDVCSKGKLFIYQGVCLGGNGNKKRLDDFGQTWTQPLLENNVKIFTGAYIFGPVIVHENAIVKAGSIITQDIEI